MNGLWANSPDGKRFAWVASMKGLDEFVVEVHSLQTGLLEVALKLDTSSYRDIEFSPDSSQVYLGTRDSIEILNVSEARWEESIQLTPLDKVDPGRVVTRRIPLGLGFPGDLFTTVPEIVYARHATLNEFCVAPSGLLAIGSETGDILLVDSATRERIGFIDERILGGSPEMIAFSPHGKHLVAYSQGVLLIFDAVSSPATPPGE